MTECPSKSGSIVIVAVWFQAKNHVSIIDKGPGMLLYSVASLLKQQIMQHRPLLVEYIAKGRISSQLQLDGEFDNAVKLHMNKVVSM